MCVHVCVGVGVCWCVFGGHREADKLNMLMRNELISLKQMLMIIHSVALSNNIVEC